MDNVFRSMKKLIFIIMIFANSVYSEEYPDQDIKISCDCDNEHIWKTEKISMNIAKKFFENYKYYLSKHHKNSFVQKNKNH